MAALQVCFHVDPWVQVIQDIKVLPVPSDEKQRNPLAESDLIQSSLVVVWLHLCWPQGLELIDQF